MSWDKRASKYGEDDLAVVASTVNLLPSRETNANVSPVPDPIADCDFGLRGMFTLGTGIADQVNLPTVFRVST